MSMRYFDLSYRLLSEAFWTRVLDHAEPARRQLAERFFADLAGLEGLRRQAQYNTGSISTATQWVLFAMASYWRPEVVAEVGTFIGKSATALAMGCDVAGVEAEVHTCDMSNRFEIPKLSKSMLLQYPGASSTAMFKELVADEYGGKVQLMHVDGRLTQEDLPLVAQLLTADGLVLLDDFEGVEKGVANAINLRSAGVLSKHLLIYPPSSQLLSHYGFFDGCTTGALLPQAALRITPQ